MAITANHLIADIRGIASSGGNPNEFKISDRQILYWAEQTRSILIAQALAKKDDIHDSWIQFIGCVELECVDESECCLVDTGCYVLKSLKQIPGTIDGWEDNSIVSVTTLAGNTISKSNHVRQKYNKYNKYTSKQRGWFLRDGYLYILNDIQLTYVNVAGLFEFPSELENFVACDNQSCWTYDSNYPITANMASVITDIVVKTKVNPFMMFPQDNTNDSDGSTPQQMIQNKQANTNSNQ